MNKPIILCFIAAIILFSSAFSVQAADVALVVKSTANISAVHEQRIKTILEEMGKNVVLIDSNSVDVNYSAYRLIVVAGRPSNEPSYNQLDSFVAQLPVNRQPTIAIDSKYIDDWGWGGGISSPYSTEPHQVQISGFNHSITTGYSGLVTVHTVPDKTLITVGRTNMTILASLPYSGNYGVVMASDANSSLYDGNTTESKIVFFGIPYPAYWSEQAADMFKKSVYWLMDDADGDGFNNTADNCPDVYNPLQTDMDHDGIGDLCDPEADGDGLNNTADNCPYIYNPDQVDSDLDGVGNVCDACLNDPTNDADGDGICGLVDNCPNASNADQKDSDLDGIGDACDTSDTRADIVVESVNVQSNVLECSALDINVSLKNRGKAGSTGYTLTLRLGGSVFESRIVADSLGVNQTAVVQFHPGDPFTCGSLLLPVRIEVSNVLPLGDINISNNINDTAVKFLPVRRADVDGDGQYEKAIDQNNRTADGYEVYEDPNNNTAATGIDGDSDGKRDYIIDINGDGTYEKYWEPDEGRVSSLLYVAPNYYIPAANGTAMKTYFNGSLGNASTINYDVNGDGANEIIADVNNNGATDGGDYIWNGGFYTLPDITVEGISLSPSSPAGGQQLTVTASLKNVGGYGAANFIVQFKWDNGSTENQTMSLASGSAGSLNFILTPSEGSHTITIVADASGRVIETNENNNQMSRSLSVSQPASNNTNPNTNPGTTYNLAIAGVEVPGTIVVDKGDEYSTEIRIINTGDVIAGAIRPYFFGSGSEFFSINPSSFILEVGEAKTAEISVRPGSSAEPGNYSVSFQLKIGSTSYYTKTITVVVQGNQTQNSGTPLLTAAANQTNGSLELTGNIVQPAGTDYSMYAVVGVAAVIIIVFILMRAGGVSTGRSAPPWQSTLKTVGKRKFRG